MKGKRFKKNKRPGYGGKIAKVLASGVVAGLVFGGIYAALKIIYNLKQ